MSSEVTCFKLDRAKIQNKTKKHHLSKTKMITAKTANFKGVAKTNMKFLENTIATEVS